MDEARAVEGRISENESDNEIGNTDTPYIGVQFENTSKKLLRKKPAKDKKRYRIILILSFFFCLFATLLSVYTIKNYNAYNVVGTSMEPTLSPNDTLILKPNKNYIKNNIVIFEKPSYWNVKHTTAEEVQVIKRIKGLPGDVFEYKNNKITINNNTIFQFNSDFKCDYKKTYKHILKSNEYFVMGDNSKTSIDSRYIMCHNNNPNDAFIHKDMIIDSGRIVFKF